MLQPSYRPSQSSNLTPNTPGLLAFAILLLLSTLLCVQPAPPQPAPVKPPATTAPTLNLATTCTATDSGFWIVGAYNKGLAFVKSTASQPQLPPYLPVLSVPVDTQFNGGRCVASNPTTVYYISDSHVGYMTVGPDGTSSNWTDWTTSPSGLNLGSLTNASNFALGYGTKTSDTILAAAVDDNILKWDMATTAATSLVSLAELGIPGIESISNMAISSGGGVTYVWIHYANSTSQQLVKVNFNNKVDRTIFTVAPAPVLASLSDANGVALLGASASGTDNTLVSYYMADGTLSNKHVTTEPNALLNDQFVVGQSSLSQINPTQLVVTSVLQPAPAVGATPSGALPLPATPAPAAPGGRKSSQLPIIIGVVVGVLALAVLAAFLIVRHRKNRGGKTSSLFARKQKNLFPAKADESLVPLGLYHQERGLPDVPMLLPTDPQRGYAPRPGDRMSQAKYSNNMAPYLTNHSQFSSQSHLDETIPVEAALAHHRHEDHTPQGLSHSISVSSTTSNFPRRSAKNGKRFEEKIQLQVIRYEIQDAHLISPHGPTGRLVLGTYHVISPPRSARSVKAQGGDSRGLARSGTVVVRRSRMDFSQGPRQGRSPSPTQRPSTPLRELAEDSSMLLTDAENQHTFEAATLKWYMTEIHWKREAALLKHLKSPIFVMELVESYCIPALQNRANTYPFVNAMGGCSSLLSEVGPIHTAAHARAILRSISAAVDWCHRHGVVHLNIQPGSFFLEEGINPKAEDASWKLWDFTCARFIGEPIGSVGGGGGESVQYGIGTPQPPPNHTQPEAYPYLEDRQLEERLDRIGGNPLPAAYTAPELLEAWRAGDSTFPAEAVMDTWSLGCVYYEVLIGQPLFQTEAEAWELVGGWENNKKWTSREFRVPYPPAPSLGSTVTVAASTGILSTGPTLTSAQENLTAYDRSQTLDPSGSIAKLLRQMMSVHADERVSLETIMERIY